MTADKNLSFVLRKVDDFVYENRPVPTISKDNDVIVQIKATGICGSDVHFYTHGKVGELVVKAPIILGHESAGIVTAVGNAVTKLQVGDKVCIEPSSPCYSCTECLNAQYNHCPKMRFAAAPPVDGTLTKFYKLSDTFCYKLPDNVSLEEGALMEPLSVAVHAVKQANISQGYTAVVFGAGPVGLLIASLLKNAYSASVVVVVDVNEDRLRFARDNYDLDTYASVKGKTAQETAQDLVEVFGLTDDRGFQYSFDATGASYCTQSAIYALKPRGTFVQTGMGADNADLPISRICFRELYVTGCFRYNGGDFKRSIDLVSRKVINVKKLISSKEKFSQAKEAFDLVKHGKGIKTIIEGPE